MITRDMCLEDDILKEMLVIRQPNGTNYLLSDNEAEILESIWAETLLDTGYPMIQTSWPVAAFSRPRNGGLGRFGRDLNSG